MAGPGKATWVKVQGKGGRVTTRAIGMTQGGGQFTQGQTITQSEFNQVRKQAAEAGTKRKQEATGKSGDNQTIERKINVGFHIRDTLVSPSAFNQLPKDKQEKILSLKKEFDSIGYIDSRTQIGPDQSKRMTQRQRDKITGTASRVFEIEREIKSLLKTDKQLSQESKIREQKARESRLTQLNAQIRLLESLPRTKSKRMNATKRTYLDAIAERDSLLNTGNSAKPVKGGNQSIRAKMKSGKATYEEVSGIVKRLDQKLSSIAEKRKALSSAVRGAEANLRDKTTPQNKRKELERRVEKLDKQLTGLQKQEAKIASEKSSFDKYLYKF